MRKFPALLALVVAAVSVAVAVPAFAQTDLKMKSSFKGKVVPKKAGTKKKPQGVKLISKVKIENLDSTREAPIVTGADIFLPKTGAWNGGKYATCSLAVLNRKGPSGCPKESLIGKGNGVAWADTVDAAPDVVIVNGGAKKIYGYTTLYRPTLVKEPVIVKINKLSGSKWGYKVSFRVPENLQIVAGVPIRLESLNVTVGGTKKAKNIITTTGCKNGKHAFEVKTYYWFDLLNERPTQTTKSSAACTK
jgi:hypothetical protein